MNRFIFCVECANKTYYGTLKATDGAAARRLLEMWKLTKVGEIPKRVSLSGVMHGDFQVEVSDG